MKKFNLSALTGDDDGSDASSDELSDDEDGSYDCAIDNYDEFVCFMEAEQAASNEDGDLLAKAGMATKEGAPAEEEEVTALRTTIAAGVEEECRRNSSNDRLCVVCGDERWFRDV